MFSNIEDAVEWVTSRRNRNHGFEHFQQVMEAEGNPQDTFRSVHIAGTNGKGSTARYLNDILMANGYKTGLYTSPHLENHRDRIRINDQWIPEAVFLKYLNQDLNVIETEDLSMFEIDTLIASQWYRDEQIDVAVIETGLGGRLDSTNTLHHPQLEIITTIGMDHMDRLGNTLGAIATEKAGIIKPNSRVLIGHLSEEARQAVQMKASTVQAEVIPAEAYEDTGKRQMKLMDHLYEVSTAAGYQKEDAAIALQAASLLGIDIGTEEVFRAVRNSMWPGRFETVHEHPLVLVDGAHNPEAMTALAASLQEMPHPIIAVFSALKDKQGQTIRRILEGACDRVIVTQFENERADTAAHLAEQDPDIEPDWQKAIHTAEALAGTDGTVIITGSLYLVSLARPYVKKQEFMHV